MADVLLARKVHQIFGEANFRKSRVAPWLEWTATRLLEDIGGNAVEALDEGFV